MALLPWPSSSSTHCQDATPDTGEDGYESASSDDSSQTIRRSVINNVTPRIASTEYSQPRNDDYRNSDSFGFQLPLLSIGSSRDYPRSTSPLPEFYPPDHDIDGRHHGFLSSDDESEPSSPLLGNDDSPLGWRTENDVTRHLCLRGSSRRRRRNASFFRQMKRILRRVVRHPLFPRQPITIVFTLLLFAIFATCLTLFLMYILNPDKDPLPWRAYCSMPATYSPPDAELPGPAPYLSSPDPTGELPPEFPPPDFDSLPPAGVFVGVFSMDSDAAFERRMLVRSTWARHPRSRYGAGEGDEAGTSRTIVRFILGQPRSSWEKRINHEMELYKDMIILPVPENMNSGKSHAYFTWAAANAWVPPLYTTSNSSYTIPSHFSYSNDTAPPPSLAEHDPSISQQLHQVGEDLPWTRPDFVVKVDDDSFLILAELEARLRVELHSGRQSHGHGVVRPPSAAEIMSAQDAHAFVPPSSEVSSFAPTPLPPQSTNASDPLIYWGYLVKNRFMAGELYALSFPIVSWVSTDSVVKGLTKGAEDKQTAKWMRIHPRASEIRWVSERCWIYDHPRSGTVYSHGFLFPSEVTRVKKGFLGDLKTSTYAAWNATAATWAPWARSTVSTFGVAYSPPVQGLSTWQTVEALVEGSEVSKLKENGPVSVNDAWRYREGRRRRYEGKRLGGTIVVHFIKKHMWFLETAMALLEGEEFTELELEQ